MRLLLDTHLLIWAAEGDAKLPKVAFAMINDRSNTLYFSAASIWEVAIKSGNKPDFNVDASLLRRELMDAGYEELPITGSHGAMIGSLPKIHNDPFDRILIAQAIVEGMELITCDTLVAKYPGPIKRL